VDAIVVDGLEKTYGKSVRALDGIRFSVREGEVYGLLGPNGAGKSTTVRILVTLTKPDGGTATVAGHDVVREAGRVRRAIGYVSQHQGVDPEATPRENLLLQGRVQGLGGGELERRVDELLERFTLSEKRDALARTMSGGQRRRLDVALGLVHRPQVLFLDEPTTGLDPTSRGALWREVRTLNYEGTTVFLTTQYLEEAEQLADRVGIIAAGRLVAEGTPEALKAHVGEPMLHVELAEAESADRVRAALSGLGTVEPAAADAPTRVVLRTAAGKGAIAPVIRALDEHDVTVESVELETPTLDDVFAAVTGSQLEGAAAVAEPA
jgi:ABC-2 type transport system ATP-binding protein